LDHSRSDGLFVCPEAIKTRSTSCRPERNRPVRHFVKKAKSFHNSEVVLVIVLT